jgi:hypothetical protein
MASTRLRLRRGTTINHQSFTGAEGEVTYDTTLNTLRAHDGETQTGIVIARADYPRGWIRSEHFLNSGTYTIIGKTDLKRIEIHIWGGGAGGWTATGGGGGGSGAYGYRVLEVSDITETDGLVTVTIGQGGAAGAPGTASSFGSYIVANGGNFGNSSGVGGTPGLITGTNTIDMGGFCGINGDGSTINGSGGGPGGSTGNATGYRGAGGGVNSSGAQGSVLIREIYGEV